MNTSWPTLLEEIAACKKCRLCQTRQHVVPGDGDPHAPLMFVGEGPGQQEDMTGRPFVGAAGRLLDRMLAAIGLAREQVYICNIVKCRPPNNRVPEADERAACMGYLRAQVALVRPSVVVCLGSTPTRALLGEDMRITRDRGVWQLKKGVWFMPTFHPAALLRDEEKKRPAWTDFKAIRDRLIELNAYPGGEKPAPAQIEGFEPVEAQLPFDAEEDGAPG